MDFGLTIANYRDNKHFTIYSEVTVNIIKGERWYNRLRSVDFNNAQNPKCIHVHIHM